MNKLLGILATAALLCGPAASAPAAPEGDGGKGRFFEDLNLDAGQKEALRRHRAEIKRRMTELKGRLEVKRVEMENELEKPEPDKDRLYRLVDEIAAIQKEKLALRVEAALALKGILTPEQFEKFRAKRENWVERKKHGKRLEDDD